MAQMVSIRAYHAPRTISECLAVLHREIGRAVVIGGGQSIAPLLKTRGWRPEVLLELGRLEALRERRLVGESSSTLELGALQGEAQAAADEAKPQSDGRASAAYRRQLIRVYGAQALSLALQRAREGLAQ